MQLAHACHALGFGSVVPASWGDELIAGAVLRTLRSFGSAPAIQCSCPKVAHRLLAVGGDLRESMISVIAPPVALARYLRDVYGEARPRITYVGRCPAAGDDSIDAHLSPEELLAMFGDAGIALEAQPRVFESVIPPDRRRHVSSPGGVPATEALWSEGGGRTLAEITSSDIALEVSHLLLTTPDVLVDLSLRLGCVCAGAHRGGSGPDARARVASIEPPRASSPVITVAGALELELPIPALSRAPSDAAIDARVAAPECMSYGHMLPALPVPVVASGVESLSRTTPPRVSGGGTAVGDSRPKHAPTSAGRPLVGSAPVTKDGGGRHLPRTYVARRRSTPRGIVRSEILGGGGVTEERRAPAITTAPRPIQAPTAARVVPLPATAADTEPIAPPLTPWPRRRILIIVGIVLLGLLIALAGAMVERKIAG